MKCIWCPRLLTFEAGDRRNWHIERSFVIPRPNPRAEVRVCQGKKEKRAYASPAFFFHRPTLLSPFSVSAPTRFSRLPARGRNKKGSRRKYFDESPDVYETFFSREFHSQRRVLLCRGVRGTEKRRKRLYLEATGPTQVRTRTERSCRGLHPRNNTRDIWAPLLHDSPDAR